MIQQEPVSDASFTSGGESLLSGVKRALGLSVEGKYRNVAEILTILTAIVLLYFLVLSSPFDFDSYWLGSWAVRDGTPMRMYSTINEPNVRGEYNLANQSPEWRDLAVRHIPVPRRMWGYIYPSPCAVLFLPFTFLPYRVAIVLWRVLNVGVYIVGLFMLLHLVRKQVTPAIGQALFFLALLSPPLLGALAMGQITPMLACSVIGGLYFAETRRQGLAGVCIAFGTLIKVSPILFVFWLLWRRQFRAIAACVGSLVALTLVSLLFTGVPVLRYYLSHCLPLLSKGTASDTNLAAVGMVGRILFPPLAGSATLLPQDIRLTIFKLSFYALLVGGSALAFWAARKGEVRQSRLLEYSIVNMVALLASPITWGHHLMTATLSIFLIVGWATQQKRWSLVVVTGVAYLFLLQNRDLAGSRLPPSVGAALALVGLLLLWLLSCLSLILASRQEGQMLKMPGIMEQ